MRIRNPAPRRRTGSKCRVAAHPLTAPLGSSGGPQPRTTPATQLPSIPPPLLIAAIPNAIVHLVPAPPRPALPLIATPIATALSAATIATPLSAPGAPPPLPLARPTRTTTPGTAPVSTLRGLRFRTATVTKVKLPAATPVTTAPPISSTLTAPTSIQDRHHGATSPPAFTAVLHQAVPAGSLARSRTGRLASPGRPLSPLSPPSPVSNRRSGLPRPLSRPPS